MIPVLVLFFHVYLGVYLLLCSYAATNDNKNWDTRLHCVLDMFKGEYSSA